MLTGSLAQSAIASRVAVQRISTRRPRRAPQVVRAELEEQSNKATTDSINPIAEQRPAFQSEPDRSKIENVEAGNISNEFAEKRADLGQYRTPSFAEVQAFDGPAPETINGRLAMLGITAALAAEFVTGEGVKEQFAKAPLPILATFALFAVASYIPIFKGFTRKEPFAYGPWTPRAENWNGRAAMIGFAALILTEAFGGKSIPAFYSSFFH